MIIGWIMALGAFFANTATLCLFLGGDQLNHQEQLIYIVQGVLFSCIAIGVAFRMRT